MERNLIDLEIALEVPFLRSGPSGQIWNVVGKMKRDHFYLLIDAGPIIDNPVLQERQRQAFGPKGGT